MFSVDFNQNLKTDFEFRNYQYVTIQFFLIESALKQSNCLNTEANFIITDKTFFLFQFKKSIRIMTIEITVRNIDANKYRTKKYVICFIYFRDTNDQRRKIRVCIRREIHLMKELKINVLIETNILTSKKFVLNFKKNETSIKSCSVIISIMFKRHEKIINQIINFKEMIIISSHFELQIRIHKFNFFEKRNFLFESKNVDFDVYVHIVRAETSNVLIRNEQSRSFRISRNARLDRIMKMKYSNVYHATDDVIDLVIRKSEFFHRKIYFHKLLKSYLSVFEIESAESKFTIRIKKKIIIHNSDFAFTKQLLKLINDYSAIWIDQNFVIFSEQKWMKISLKKNFETKTMIKIIVYSLKTRNRELIDQIFDELHKKKRLEWTFQKTFWSYFCFVIWKIGPDDIKKNKVMMNVKHLNSLIVFDVYFLSLQFDIIAAIQNCFYIFVIDCVDFFYQWRVHFFDRHKLTVINHRKQKSFNVTVMKYKNSFAYVQRQIDRFLRFCRSFVRIYIDDVIIFFKISKKHFVYFEEIFRIFRKFNILIKSFKIFFVYFSIQFLDQRVNSLKLITNENKLRAINKLKFSITFRKLEHYLELTNWLKKYVKNYVKISKSLQNKKILMLKKSSVIDESVRKFYSAKIAFQNLIENEIRFYKELQKKLFSFWYFVHHNHFRQLYMNVDFNKKEKMNAMMYHFKQIIDDYFARFMIESIMFLNRRITDAEFRYWFTELKIADLIWIIKKTKHMINSVQQFFIIYTDHETAIEISRQKTLFTFSTDKLNFRLIKVSEYIQRFNLIIRHKSEKKHIISNVFFRFETERSNSNLKKKN